MGSEQRRGVAEEHAFAGAAPRRDHDRHRGRESERARAGDDEHRDRIAHSDRRITVDDQPCNQDDQRDAYDRWHEHPRDAIREALAEVGSVLLQPIMKIDIHVPSVFSGGLVPVVTGLKGQVLGFEAHESAAGWDVFQALLPQAAEDELFNALAGATRGTAWFTSWFDHSQEARKEELAGLI